MVEVPVKLYLDKVLKTAREAVRPTALLTGPVRDKALRAMAAAIAESEEAILAANETDVDAVGKSMTGYENRERVRDAVARIRMTADDVKALVDRLHRIADLPDPLGDVLGRHDEPNGLQVGRVRVPIGVIGIVSELSPLETIDALALCLKSGNVCVFRGSPDWTHTQQIIAAGLNCDHLVVEGDGRHWYATIVSAEFEGKRAIQRHQRVYATLGEKIRTDEVHALSMKTFTPAEWAAQPR